MGHVADAASAGFEGRMHLGAFQPAQHIPVAVKTELILGLDQILIVIAGMRTVAARAGAVSDRTVHVDLVEFLFFVRVTRVAERLNGRVEQRRFFGSVRIVTGRTSFRSERSMNRLAFEVARFVVTRKADLAAIGGRQEPGVGRGMGIVTSGALFLRRHMARSRFDRFTYVTVARSAELALPHLKDGLDVGCVRTVAQGALSPFERHMRDLLFEKIALFRMTHQAKIGDRRGDGEWSLRVRINMAGATSHHHAGMDGIANNLDLRGAVRSMAIGARRIGHRVAAMRFGDVGGGKIVALLA